MSNTVIEEITTTLPDGTDGKCGIISLTAVSSLKLENVTEIGEKYTFSIYVKTDADCEKYILGAKYNFKAGQWIRIMHKFDADNTYFQLTLPDGTFYLYKAQLEKGTVVTDWHINTDDIEDLLNECTTAIGEWCHENDMTFIDGGKIATGTVTAQQINVNDLFAQNIKATGTIEGITLKGSSGEFTEEFRVCIPEHYGGEEVSYFILCDDGAIKIGSGIFTETDGEEEIEIYTYVSAGYDDLSLLSKGLLRLIASGEMYISGHIINLDGDVHVSSDVYGMTSSGQTKKVIAGMGGTDGIYFGTGGDITGQTTYIRGNTVRLYAFSSGAVYLGASGSTAVTSDEKLKDIYELDDRYLNFFNNLKPIKYIYKDTEKSKHTRVHLGFGARQVEKALADTGLTTNDFAGVMIDKDVTLGADEMGTDEDVHFDELYSLRYEEFIALNTAMIQKHTKEIETLNRKIGNLESQMLKNRLKRLFFLIKNKWKRGIKWQNKK